MQSTSTPVKFGFVPADYIKPVAASSASVSAAPAAASPASPASTVYPQQSASQFNSPGTAAGASAGNESFLNRLGSSAVPPSPAASVSVSRFGATNVTGVSSSAAAEEFGQLFASHEEWFRAATAKRKEVYGQLIGEANDIGRALQEAESRSTNVLNRIHELDRLIGDEKARWQQKLAEDGAITA